MLIEGKKFTVDITVPIAYALNTKKEKPFNLI